MLNLQTLDVLTGGVSAALTSLATPELPDGMTYTGTDWLTRLDHSCGRLAPGFWGEPFDTNSNPASLIAAGVILHRQRWHTLNNLSTGLAQLAAERVSPQLRKRDGIVASRPPFSLLGRLRANSLSSLETTP